MPSTEQLGSRCCHLLVFTVLRTSPPRPPIDWTATEEDKAGENQWEDDWDDDDAEDDFSKQLRWVCFGAFALTTRQLP